MRPLADLPIPPSSAFRILWPISTIMIVLAPAATLGLAYADGNPTKAGDTGPEWAIFQTGVAVSIFFAALLMVLAVLAAIEKAGQERVSDSHC